MFRKGKKRQSPVFSALKEIDQKSGQTAEEAEPIPFETSAIPTDKPVGEPYPSGVFRISGQEAEEADPAPFEASAIPADTPIREPSPSGIFRISEQEVENSPDSISALQMREKPAFEDGRAEDPASLFESSFISINPGTFFMGSAEYEVGRDNGEVLHEVTLTKRFHIQTTPVTQAQWRSVMGTNPSRFTEGGGDKCPVENVTWHDCLDFIKTLNRTSEDVYRLPTEAEWEYACRAGSMESSAEGMIMELFCGHDHSLDAVGWYCGNSNRRTHPVASKNANEWGLYDMHGNVFEWCQDWYGTYSSEKSVDPLVSWPGPGRVIRGGSWFANAKNCRSAARLYWSPQSKSDFIGFRLVKEAD